MTDTRRKASRSDPASREPFQAQSKSSAPAAVGREPDPSEDYRQMLKRLDELGAKLAEQLGIPVTAVIGSLTPEQRFAEDMAELEREEAEDLEELEFDLAEDMEEFERELAEAVGARMPKKTRRAKPAAPAKPELTPEQRAAREAALMRFKYLPRKSTTLH